MTARAILDRFLRSDPADVGCDEAMRMLHVYVELVLDPHSTTDDRRVPDADPPNVAEAAARYPGIAAHLAACGPCGQDYEGLLASVRTNPPDAPHADKEQR